CKPQATAEISTLALHDALPICHPLDADVGKGLADFVQLKWLNNGHDQLHVLLLKMSELLHQGSRNMCASFLSQRDTFQKGRLGVHAQIWCMNWCSIPDGAPW